MNAVEIRRRGFLQLAGGLGAGLVLGFSVEPTATEAAAGETTLNIFVRVAPDNTVILYTKVPEIGQGIKTSFPMILADEMDADWSKIRIEQAPVNVQLYGIQNAGGSRSTYSSWTQLRKAGATARAMLISAAAQNWNVPATEGGAANSFVIHKSSHRRESLGELA